MLALDQVQILYSRHSNKEAVTAVSVSANWEEKKKKKSTVLHLCSDKEDLTYEVKIYKQDK